MPGRIGQIGRIFRLKPYAHARARASGRLTVSAVQSVQPSIVFDLDGDAPEYPLGRAEHRPPVGDELTLGQVRAECLGAAGVLAVTFGVVLPRLEQAGRGLP